MKTKAFITRTLSVLLIAGLLAGLLLAALPPVSAYAAIGDADSAFDSRVGANDLVRSMAVQNDGKVIIGGLFTTYNGVARNHIARINTDGSLDTSFDPGSGTTGLNGNVMALAVQGDGKILIGGNFTTYNGVARSRIARLNADGSLDTTFDPGTGVGPDVSSYLMAIIVQGDGQILISGYFTTYNGVARGYVARLNPDGSLDTSFDSSTGANSLVTAAALQGDGKILIGGYFTTYNGTARSRIARLNADGSLDTTFDPGSGASNTVYAITVQGDGQILIGGLFTTYNGVARSYIARLNPDGSLDTTFTGPGTVGATYAIAVQSDGKILTGRITRLNPDGSPDTTFNPGSGANTTVYAIAVQSNGQIFICGAFTSFNDTARNRIARLGGPDMALSSPAVDPADIIAGTTDLVVYRLNIAVTSQWAGGAILTGLTLTPGGTYLPADLVANSFRLRYSADATLDAGDPLLSTRDIVASGSPLAFTGLSQAIAVSSAGYLFVTVDVAPSITGKRTLTINAPTLSNVAFDSGSKSGVLTAGGTQTFIVSIYADPAGICEGHTYCYTSLQAAIDAAGPDCSVAVYGGTYAESVTLDKNTPVRLLGDATITGNLTLAIGAFHVLTHTLTVGGDFTNIAPFEAGTGTLVLNGSGLQTIGGAGVTTFNHLTIANTSGLTPAVKLKTDAVVNGTLTLQAGALGIYAESFTLNGPVNTTGGSMARLLSTTTYAQAAPGQNVAPGQYGHLAFNDQPKTLPDGGTLAIQGDFDPGTAGGHTVAGSTVAFNGSGTQTIAHGVALNDVSVGSGVTLTTAANVTVAGTLTNDGWTKETKAVVGAGPLPFGLANTAVEVTTPGSLASLEVTRRDRSHPNATLPLQTHRYWSLEPNSGAAGFVVTLTLPADFVPDGQDKVCRYTGAGQVWDCAMSSFDAALHTITRAGVTAFSDWAASNDAGPTAVDVSLIKAQSPAAGWGALIGLAGLALMVCLGRLVRGRKRLTFQS